MASSFVFVIRFLCLQTCVSATICASYVTLFLLLVGSIVVVFSSYFIILLLSLLLLLFRSSVFLIREGRETKRGREGEKEKGSSSIREGGEEDLKGVEEGNYIIRIYYMKHLSVKENYKRNDSMDEVKKVVF